MSSPLAYQRVPGAVAILLKPFLSKPIYAVMNAKRFQQVDHWLTKTLRYSSTIPLTVEELYRRASKLEFGKQEILWVASTATKSIPRAPSIYRFVVERCETGLFVSLNATSEQYHLIKKRTGEQEKLCPGDVSEEIKHQRKRRQKDESVDLGTLWTCCKEDPYL